MLRIFVVQKATCLFFRSTLASVEDFESRLNEAMERNAFLESELDEKESLKAAVQRLKDETRDLKSELRLLAPRHPNLSSLDSTSIDIPDNDRSKNEANNNANGETSTAESKKMAADMETKSERAAANGTNGLDTPSASSAEASPSTGSRSGRGGQPLAPSARASALNIVGDLLRKVGALELKLVSCRNIVKETSGTSTSALAGSMTAVNGGSPSLSSSGDASSLMDRSRRIPRGGSTPAIKKIAADTSA